MERSHLLTVLGLALGLGASAGCAPPRAGATSVTAATVAAPASGDPAAGPDAADETGLAGLEPPPGELVCKSVRPLDGLTELFIVWHGEDSEGVLRTVSASGNVTDQKVTAARYQGMIIADEPHNMDLVKHAAVVRPEGGKLLLRVGDKHQMWTPCAR